ncbi:hypothetical protein BV898_14522 [Hypsibius exemplaris]|uniref:Uncharacterized protein n=1 Tax=Hypsibius exemplaris TaxID=2072580 RepID=A0A9X6NG12_HYPEX|nr:hypothetical protein BV898_14522 [Hypsibius exemplaris]
MPLTVTSIYTMSVLSYFFVMITGAYWDSALAESIPSFRSIPALPLHQQGAAKRAFFRRYSPITAAAGPVAASPSDEDANGPAPLKPGQFGRNTRDKIFQNLRLHPFLRFMAEERMALRGPRAGTLQKQDTSNFLEPDEIEAPEFLG